MAIQTKKRDQHKNRAMVVRLSEDMRRLIASEARKRDMTIRRLIEESVLLFTMAGKAGP